jgi:hypothetical protein
MLNIVTLFQRWNNDVMYVVTLCIATLFQLWDNAVCRSVFEALEWSFASWLCFNVEMTLCAVALCYRWNDVVCCDIVLPLKWRWVSWRCFNVEMTSSASSIVIWYLPIFFNMGSRGFFSWVSSLPWQNINMLFSWKQ